VLKRTLMASRSTFRRAGVAVLGSAVMLFGILLIVLPGPAFIVIPAGLAILGLEFAWARRLARIARERSRETVSRVFSPRGQSWRSY
jgi:uncharacterized protein (TIGR02611 family)